MCIQCIQVGEGANILFTSYSLHTLKWKCMFFSAFSTKLVSSTITLLLVCYVQIKNENAYQVLSALRLWWSRVAVMLEASLISSLVFFFSEWISTAAGMSFPSPEKSRSDFPSLQWAEMHFGLQCTYTYSHRLNKQTFTILYTLVLVLALS